MYFKSISIKILTLLSALGALAFEGDRKPVEFYLSSNRIFSPGENNIAVEFSGQVDAGSRVELTAYRIVDPVAFFLAQKNPHSPGTSADDENSGKAYALDTRDGKKFVRITSWDLKLTSRDRYWQYQSIPVPVKEKGVYLIAATIDGRTATAPVVITELGMIVKQTKGEALAFVVNRKNGERVTDMPITFARGGKNSTASRTGSDGVAKAAIAGLMTQAAGTDDEQWGYGNQLVALGARDGNFVISDSYYYGSYGNGENTQIYLHTDRPVYRPAQKVYYRGIVRRVNDEGTFETVTNDSVEINVTDARGASIKKDHLPLSDMGTFSGELTLGDEPPLGDYSINVTRGTSEHPFTFTVEEYKKPEYEVTVTTDRQQYTRGDEITAKIKADYYFGSPVAEGDVHYTILRSRYWRPWWAGSDWAYLYEGMEDELRVYNYGMEQVANGDGKLNPDGTFTVTYRTDRAKEKNDDQDYVYRIQANVVDASRRSIGGMAAVKVTRGEFYVTARTGKYVYKPGDEMRMDVTTLAFDGDRPVSARFDVSVERYWWERNSRDHRETVWTGSGTTDRNGAGSVAFALKEAGYYTATITARDSRGTAISTSTSVYVADGSYSYWYGESNNDVQIIPDKEIYKPGETMSALVIMPVANVDALITTEGIALYNYQVQRLSSTSAIIRMPIEARFAPTVYLAASSIVNENFHTVTKRITVVPQGKILKLEVKTDRDIYKPGEKGSVTVRALDDNGEPVANTDIALSMVDEAVYAIHPDATPEIQKFFYGSRGNEVGTSTSLNFNFYTSARRSLARDEARGGAAGEMAMQSMAAPKMAFSPAAPPPGNALVQPVIRTDFRDLMYWTPSVRTDRNGVAHIDVTFPDNLTTWRITARGVTRATAVGQAKASVIARKNLLVRMETPRFITQGDALVIATTIHNYLGSEKKVRVEFAANGVTLTEREKTVSIPADGEKRIDWKITAPKIGTAKLTVKALTNEESDAMELSVPVLPQGVRSGASAIADLDERTSSGSMTLSIPANSTTESAGLTLALAPSAASSILGALDELIGYPYGCVEQTMSRFLPTVVVADALGKIKVPFSEAKRLEIPKMVAKGLGRLSELQHEDGGWGWWENDETNPFMTAYVMYGLTVAKGSGYDIPDDRYNNGLAALRRLIESRRSGGGLGSSDKKLEPTTEAYMLYVASFISKGSPDRLYTDRIAELAKRSDINNYGQALLALAAHYQNQSGLAGQFADRLRANAKVSESIARWSGKSWHYNWQDDEVETSAFAVKALLEIRGEDDLVRKGIHFLLSQKKGTAWENTRQTAMVIYSLVDYVRNSHELDPDYTVTVRVNGRQVFTRHITSADIFAPEQQITVGSEGLRNGANDITIEKSGSGKLYASARMNYYVTGAAIKSASAGFKVERQYYTLRREQKNGTYVYTKQPYTGSVKSGDEIFVKVKITPDAASEYFMLEDPLPAGCEVVTNTDGYTIVDEGMYGGFNGGGKRGYMPYIWRWWYADRDVRDEKVAFFAPSLGAQTYEFSYVMRAQIPGNYSIMPSVGMLMYYPDVRGNSDAIAMTIRD